MPDPEDSDAVPMSPERLDPRVDDQLATELVTLQRAAYAVEAGLIGSDAIPALHETATALAAADLAWFGIRDDLALLGAVAVENGADVAVIDRLFVSPLAFRRGVGSALVRHVLAVVGGGRVVVSTGRDNLPARALYRRLGFAETGEAEVEPGLWLTRMVRGVEAPSGPPSTVRDHSADRM
ncbi:MAG: GNAT family N-acetyltransferase [Dermatophilaceae bacterium]